MYKLSQLFDFKGTKKTGLLKALAAAQDSLDFKALKKAVRDLVTYGPDDDDVYQSVVLALEFAHREFGGMAANEIAHESVIRVERESRLADEALKMDHSFCIDYEAYVCDQWQAGRILNDIFSEIELFSFTLAERIREGGPLTKSAENLLDDYVRSDVSRQFRVAAYMVSHAPPGTSVYEQGEQMLGDCLYHSRINKHDDYQTFKNIALMAISDSAALRRRMRDEDRVIRQAKNAEVAALERLISLNP